MGPWQAEKSRSGPLPLGKVTPMRARIVVLPIIMALVSRAPIQTVTSLSVRGLSAAAAPAVTSPTVIATTYQTMFAGATNIGELTALGPQVDGAALAAECPALATTADFSKIQDATTRVINARLVEASGELPAYCQVLGMVLPNVGFELRLP